MTSGRRRKLAVLTAWALFGIWLAASGAVESGHGAPATGQPVAQDVEEVHVKVRGTGRVVSIPRGIECNGECDQRFRHGTEVVLVAGSRPEWRFVSWSGACFGRSTLCVLVADRTTRVTATFEPDPDPDIGLPPHARYNLFVTAPSTGGTIRSEPARAGIRCPRACAGRFLSKTRIALKAYPKRGYVPIWETYPPGICRGDRCEVVLRNADAHVSATFKRASR